MVFNRSLCQGIYNDHVFFAFPPKITRDVISQNVYFLHLNLFNFISAWTATQRSRKAQGARNGLEPSCGVPRSYVHLQCTVYIFYKIPYIHQTPFKQKESSWYNRWVRCSLCLKFAKFSWTLCTLTYYIPEVFRNKID